MLTTPAGVTLKIFPFNELVTYRLLLESIVIPVSPLIPAEAGTNCELVAPIEVRLRIVFCDDPL
ncbi:unannotated protein [freshwater metagenome]|uniref:Unannotated protein n=1 Tax=freshwater metagenome TaxID=449393 RepID=A0A6J6NR89_9ZZZZ